MRRFHGWWLLVLVAGPSAWARAQSTTRVSVDSNGAQANGTSWNAAISAEGRFIAFTSDASNLVPGDTNGRIDVFVRDRVAGTTELASVSSNGAPANGVNAFCEALSAFGQFVVFTSDATSLVPADTNGVQDVFVRDRAAGTTERVSVDSNALQANGVSRDGAVSADGRYVAFASDAANLVPGDTNGWSDVFVRDRLMGTTERVSVSSAGAQGNHASLGPSISADGRFVAFESLASNFAPTDAADFEVFVRDRQAGTTRRVSGPGTGDVGDSGASHISADGRFVAFQQTDAGFSRCDVLVHDGATDTIELQTVGSGFSFSPSLAADGRCVVFHSNVTFLVPGDTNAAIDVFRRDRPMDALDRLSLDSAGAQGNGDSTLPAISADGRLVVFTSAATNLVAGDTNGVRDIFVRELAPAVADPFCFGDGVAAPCPCGNSGRLYRGCQNSDFTDGAFLAASGSASLSSDTLFVTSSRGKGQALSVFLQGDVAVDPMSYGDGLRCVAGTLKRLYVRNAFGGVVSAPVGAELPFSARSAQLNDPIAAGTSRFYQVMYRDPVASWCPNPPGNSWNVSNALAVVWSP